MQEKKNKQLALLLLVLSAATVAVFWLGREEDNFTTDKDLFRKFDLKSVDKVVLESAGKRVSLTFNGSMWKVNDQFNADASLIEVLFATLKQAEPKRPLASSQQDSVQKVVRRNGVKVSLMVGTDSAQIFYAGGNLEKTQAYFVDPVRNIPYLMTIPGYRVYVSGIFELPEPGWRDKYVFRINWRNFQSLDVHFPKNPADDFKVALENNVFGIQGLPQTDTTKLNDLLDNISFLTVEEYLEKNPSLDSLSQTSPLTSLVVKDISKKEYALSLFPPLRKGSSMLGLINGSQWALFPQNAINGIVRPRHFFEK